LNQNTFSFSNIRLVTDQPALQVECLITNKMMISPSGTKGLQVLGILFLKSKRTSASIIHKSCSQVDNSPAKTRLDSGCGLALKPSACVGSFEKIVSARTAYCRVLVRESEKNFTRTSGWSARYVIKVHVRPFDIRRAGDHVRRLKRFCGSGWHLLRFGNFYSKWEYWVPRMRQSCGTQQANQYVVSIYPTAFITSNDVPNTLPTTQLDGKPGHSSNNTEYNNNTYDSGISIWRLPSISICHWRLWLWCISDRRNWVWMAIPLQLPSATQPGGGGGSSSSSGLSRHALFQTHRCATTSNNSDDWTDRNYDTIPPRHFINHHTFANCSFSSDSDVLSLYTELFSRYLYRTRWQKAI